MSLHDAMASANIPAPPPNLRSVSSGFIRWGKGNRYWMKQQDGVVLFGDWGTGESHHWFEDNDKPMDTQAMAARKAKLAEMRKQQEHEQARIYDEKAARAEKLWDAMAEVGDSNYLARKQVASLGIRFYNDSIAVPLLDVEGKLWGLQFIQPNGEKRFLTGGKKRGCFHTIGQLGDAVIIAEGYATAASIHMATAATCIVAFDAGNLEPVVQALRGKYPAIRVTIAGDNDCWKRDGGNVGKDKSEAVAAKYDCNVILPQFSNKAKIGQPTDFNDLHVLDGLEAVKAQLETATVSESAAMSIEQLATLPPLEYEKIRESEAKRLGARMTALDKEVETIRKQRQTAPSKSGMFPDVALWPHPVDGALLLHEMVSVIRGFIVCNSDTATATALWCAFTWLVDYVQVAPLAVITAPEKRCGKSQLLNLIAQLACRPLVASNISPAATFRVIEAHRPTLLIDEADTFLKDNEELRGVINSGHTRQSAYVIRNVGDNHEPKQFSTWGAKAISGIGSLSDTIMDRAIILTLRRKLSGENVQRLRHADAGLFDALASKLARFANDNGAAIALARPALPDALNDRAQDNWEPLLAIADCAGGEWPSIARTAALTLSGAEHDSVSLSTELLADIRDAFDSKGVNRISTADLIKALCDDDEKSWATYNRGKPITPRQLSKHLSEYDIASKNVRIGYDTPKGFDRAQFEDAFTRYLSSPPSATATTPQTSTSLNNAVADTISCSGTDLHYATSTPVLTNDCGGVADYLPPAATDTIVEVIL